MLRTYCTLLTIPIVLAACSTHRTEPKTFTWEELKSIVHENSIWDAYRNPDGADRKIKWVVSQDSLVLRDEHTGLFWQRSSSDRIPQEDARSYVDRLNASGYGGFSDWRIPTIEELYSILLKSTHGSPGLHMDTLFDNSRIVLSDVFPNQAMLLSCDEIVLTLLDKTPIGTNPLYVDFAAGLSCGAGGDRSIRAVRGK